MLIGSLDVRQPTEGHEVAGMGPTANTEDGEDEVETAWTPRAFLGPKPNGTPPHLVHPHTNTAHHTRLAPASLESEVELGEGGQRIL